MTKTTLFAFTLCLASMGPGAVGASELTDAGGEIDEKSQPVPVPEASTCSLASLGMVALIVFRRRR
jgi:hypothetical protein